MSSLDFNVDAQARAVVCYLEDMLHWGDFPLANTDGLRFSVTTLRNGRERHIAIEVCLGVFGRCLVVEFGENRNSDEIVVQTVTLDSAPFNGPELSHLTLASYDARRRFALGCACEAALHCSEIIGDFVREEAALQAELS